MTSRMVGKGVYSQNGNTAIHIAPDLQEVTRFSYIAWPSSRSLVIRCFSMDPGCRAADAQNDHHFGGFIDEWPRMHHEVLEWPAKNWTSGTQLNKKKVGHFERGQCDVSEWWWSFFALNLKFLEVRLCFWTSEIWCIDHPMKCGVVSMLPFTMKLLGILTLPILGKHFLDVQMISWDDAWNNIALSHVMLE